MSEPIQFQARKPPREPMFNLPPMVQALALVNIAIYVPMAFSSEIREVAVYLFGFVPGSYVGRMDRAIWQLLVTPISYQFLHGSIAHLLMNMVALAAFGAGVERSIGPRRTLFFTLACGVIAALAEFAAGPHDGNFLIGASGGVSGLFAAAVLLLYRRGVLARGPHGILPLVLVFVALNLLQGFVGAPGAQGAPIGWIAHLGGFFAGLALYPLFDRAPKYDF